MENYLGVVEYLIVSLAMPFVAFYWVQKTFTSPGFRYLLKSQDSNHNEKLTEHALTNLIVVIPAIFGYWMIYVILTYPIALGITLVLLMPYRLLKALYIFVNICRHRSALKKIASQEAPINRKLI